MQGLQNPPAFFAHAQAVRPSYLGFDPKASRTSPFISDRVRLMFDLHQIVDGSKEAELGGSSIGTMEKGLIDPAC